MIDKKVVIEFRVGDDEFDECEFIRDIEDRFEEATGHRFNSIYMEDD